MSFTIKQLAALAETEPRGGLIEIPEDDALSIVVQFEQLERELGKYRQELRLRDRELAAMREKLAAALRVVTTAASA